MRKTRRDILKSGIALTAVTGCGGGLEERIPNSPEGLPPVPVDIHNHIFNATDIPIAGFAEQVLLRDPETPVPAGPTVLRSLIQLIVDIVLAAQSTPTAAQEYRSLDGLKRLEPRDGGDLLREDRRAVARGLAILENKAQVAAQRRTAPNAARAGFSEPNGDELLFARLAAESGVEEDTVGTFERLGPNLRSQSSQASEIAARVYQDVPRDGPSTFTTLAERTAPDQSFAQTLRWAGLLTRSRVDILGELIRLYAHRPDDAEVSDRQTSNGVKVFSPSLVDFTYWLGADSKRDKDRSGSDILEQLKVLSRITELERSALLLPFAPFCPLRAAVYRKNGKGVWLDRIKSAVNSMGFAGVKLYPPMGFLPLGNNSFDVGGRPVPQALGRFGISGAEIDRELSDLYDWCAAEEVPIKAHGNDSLGADTCTGQNAAAQNWEAVLQTPRWGNLRLNIAHYGGFDERFDKGSGCPSQSINYEAQATDLIIAHDHVYVDLGYWTQVTGTNRTLPDNGASATQAHLDVRRLLAEQLGRTDRLKRRMMFGSDWSMIGREEQHASYFQDVRNALKAEDLGLTEQEQRAILGANALRYLGMDRRGKQYARLSNFFGESEQFKAVEALIQPASGFGAALRDFLTARD